MSIFSCTMTSSAVAKLTAAMAQLLAAGKLRPVIAKTFSLDQIVAAPGVEPADR